MEFLWPMAFLLLPLPYLVRRFANPTPIASSGALRVPFYRQLASHPQGTGRRSVGTTSKLLLAGSIWLLLVVAVARPVIVGEEVPLPREGRDLMMAIDLSGSMAREDFALNGRRATRLDVVKDAAIDFINRREGDRLGLILFSERAYLQAPLTFDRQVVGELLGEAGVGLTGQQTAIGDAIGVAIKRLKDRPVDSRVLILLTDGASNAGVLDPIQAAKVAKDFGIRIYTIGVGASPSVVRTAFGRQVVDPSRDLDEATLKQIADTTGGQYFRARDVDGLASVYADIDRLEPVDGEPESVRPVDDLFYWPLGAALALTFIFAASLPGAAGALRIAWTPLKPSVRGA